MRNDEKEFYVFFEMIYHVTTRHDWEINKEKLSFAPADFFREGFIHCCTPLQLDGVLDRYFKGKTGLVLLKIDESKLTAPLKFESSTNDELFPHLYGELNTSAVIGTEER